MSKMIRDKKVCFDRLVKGKDGNLLTKANCRLQIPERWTHVGLATITDTSSIYGFFPIIFDDNYYCVMNVCAIIEITPTRTTQVTINEETYFEFHFDANSSIIKSLELVRQDTLTFNVMDEFIMKGKVPWWGTVDDMCMIFDTAHKNAGSSIAKIPQTIEFLVGIISRNINDRTKLLRQSAKTWDDYELDQIEFIALKSVLLAVSNTISKLSGAYFSEGVISAIVNPSTKTGKIERILRT